jgi:antirestriction protein ArdC
MSNALYQAITDQIIAKLETGVTPWIKPWKTDSSADKNAITGSAYKGINRLLLGMSSMAQGFDSPYWASYDQWQQLGGQVRKGEKATQGVFFKPQVVKKGKNGDDDSTYRLLKAFWVFNVSQVDGVTITKPETDNKPFNAIEAVENHVNKLDLRLTHGGDVACYSPTLDMIKMPNKNAFKDESSYYATLLHEITHWTGHEKRCNRKLSGRFGNPEYAFEELVAEIGAAYLCGDFKITGQLQHADYIGSWLKACRSDSKIIFKAAALAQKAADYVNTCGQSAAQMPVAA